MGSTIFRTASSKRCFTTTASGEQQEQPCAFRSPQFTSQYELDMVVRALDPVGLALQDDAEVLRSWKLPYDAPSMRVCPKSSCPTLLLRMAGCASDILRLEAEPGRRRFRWVVRSRPDLLWTCRLPDVSQWPSLWPTGRNGRSSMLHRATPAPSLALLARSARLR
jgi:hypothetical protein